jgi:hypothetical protein
MTKQKLKNYKYKNSIKILAKQIFKQKSHKNILDDLNYYHFSACSKSLYTLLVLKASNFLENVLTLGYSDSPLKAANILLLYMLLAFLRYSFLYFS